MKENHVNKLGQMTKDHASMLDSLVLTAITIVFTQHLLLYSTFTLN